MAQDENSTTLTREEFERLRREYMCGAAIRKGWQIWRNGEPYLLTLREIAIIQGEQGFPPEQIEHTAGGVFMCGLCLRVFPLNSPHSCVALDSDKPTMRDQFAMAAPIGFQRVGAGSYGTNAIARYEWADAMMAARKNPPK